METSFVREQEEETTRAAAASQAKQGQWMNWDREDQQERTMGANRIKLIVEATYDVL